MSLWDQAVEDGIGDGGLDDVFVPFGDGDLGGDNGSCPFVTVFEDLEQQEFDGMADGLQTKVIEDKEFGFFDPVQPFDDGAFSLGQGDLLAEVILG